MTNQDYITIAIPIFNENNGILRLIGEALDIPLNKEIIVIDDGSTNIATLQIIAAMREKYPEVIILTNKKNLGKSSSIQLALEKAKGNIFVVLDGDAELSPKDIIRLYTSLRKEDARFANGARVTSVKERPRSFSRLVTKFAKITFGSFVHFFYGTRIKDILSGYKMFYTDDFRNHRFSTKRFGLESDLLVTTLKNKRKMVEIDVDYYPRNYKQGKRINFLDGIEILRCIMSNIPLRRSTLQTPFGIFSIGIVLWLFTFSIYTLDANSSSTSDSIPNNFTTVNILYNNRLDLTNFQTYFLKKHQKSVVVKNKDGILYAKTPVINGILATPYFYVFDQLHHIHNVSAGAFIHKDYETYYQSVGKYYAATLASISVFVIFLTLYTLYKNLLYALFGAFAYGFVTMTYSTAAQGNWQHAPSLLLISASFYIFISFLRSKRQFLLISISFLLALATLIRISNIFFFIAIISVLLFYKQYRKFVIYPITTFFLLIVIWQGITSAMGIPGGYNSEIIKSLQSFNLFYIVQVIISLLISPNVGLLIFCPLSILSFLGIYKILGVFFRNTKEGLQSVSIFLLTSIISFFLIFLFNSFWWAWEGGYSWGPRLLTEGGPFLIYLGTYGMSTLRDKIKKTICIIVFFILFLYSILIHAVGVYADDNDWHNKYYKEGTDRMVMAWQMNPGVLWYYIVKRKIFFTQRIIKDKRGVKIEKVYYYIDLAHWQFNKINTVIKLL